MEWQEFQQYVETFCEKKGFTNVSDEARYLFLMSEVGEMSKELLKLQWANEEEKKDIKTALSHELFDIIWNTVEIANRHEIDLTQAFSEKMKINAGRSWGS